MSFDTVSSSGYLLFAKSFTNLINLYAATTKLSWIRIRIENVELTKINK